MYSLKSRQISPNPAKKIGQHNMGELWGTDILSIRIWQLISRKSGGMKNK